MPITCHSSYRALVILATVSATSMPSPAQDSPWPPDAGRSPFRDKPVVSYTGAAGLTWGQARYDDFGPRPIAMVDDGMRQPGQVPPPGIHPRILCSPADLPDIRRRLKDTQCGRAAWKNLLCWTEMLKGSYDDSAEYAKPYAWNGSHRGLRSRVPLFRLNAPLDKDTGYNRSRPAAELYHQLADGTATVFPDYYWHVFALEAFRCWIDDDAAAARLLAGAVVTSMRVEQAKRAAKSPQVPPHQPVGGIQLAFAYDFIHGWLDPEQRAAIHAELAESTWSHDNYGTFNEASAGRSNWATFSYWLIQVLAIEGEPGFNELKVRGMYRGWRNMLTYGWFESGATYEGEAKSQLGMDGVLAFAMRREAYGFDNPGGHPHLRAYARRFLPMSVIPDGTGFIAYDLLGGAHGRPMAPDSLGLKVLFPEDRVIDWVYRRAVGENYEHVPDRCDGYRNDLLFFLIFADDFMPDNAEPARLGLPATFFCGERALLMTRSGWEKEAVMLNMHTRQANGGHAFADRNSLMLAGAGRVWSPPGYASFHTTENSVVAIDGRTQDLDTPGRMVDFVDTPLATFATGDAKHAWDWNWQTLSRGGKPYTRDDLSANAIAVPVGWEKVEYAVNSFSYRKQPFSYLEQPLFGQPHWLGVAGTLSPVVRQPNLPVRMAFRTAGLTRGKYPYALVADDIQVDDTAHLYEWILALENDIGIVTKSRRGKQLDILLQGTLSDARLLVRVLDASQCGEPFTDDFPNCTKPAKYGPVRRLVIPSRSVNPGFKVLLYPHRPGAAMPDTRFDDGRLGITFPGQQDHIRFTSQGSGKSDLVMIRAGSPDKVEINRPVPPLHDATAARR